MSRDKIDQEELRSQLYYMYYYQSEHADWFESNQLPVKVRGGLGSYDLVSDLIDSDRFRNKLIQSNSEVERAVESGRDYVNVDLSEIAIEDYNQMHFLEYNSKAKISDFTITYNDNGKKISREFKNEFYSFCKSLDRQAPNQPAFNFDWSEGGKQFRLIIYRYNFPFDTSDSDRTYYISEGVLLVK